ncbi:UNVERIFIED_CONTAM: hypothetical protein HDU68_006262 [Siphonaria sp. JEL0065]|nr:hypothetical protein HDU68_006262 [Siphonaria sp. JEL0065]
MFGRKTFRIINAGITGKEYYIKMKNESTVPVEVIGTVSLVATARPVLENPFVLQPGEERSVHCKQGRIFTVKHFKGEGTSRASIFAWNIYSFVQPIVMIADLVSTGGTFSAGVTHGVATAGSHAAPMLSMHASHAALAQLGVVHASAFVHLAGSVVGNSAAHIGLGGPVFDVTKALVDVFGQSLSLTHAIIPPDVIHALFFVFSTAEVTKVLTQFSPAIKDALKDISGMVEESGEVCDVQVEYEKSNVPEMQRGRLHVHSKEIPCHYSIKGGLEITANVIGKLKRKLTETSKSATDTKGIVQRLILRIGFKNVDFHFEKTYSEEFF